MNQERGAVPPENFRFGLFEADVAQGTLTRKGVRVRIQDQPFRVLVTLLERPGEIVTREELRQKLWSEGIHVDFDGSLNVTLKKLRAALDDESDNPRFIETVPRHGYRFIAPVTASQAASEPERAEPPQMPHRPVPGSAPPVAILFGRIWLWASIVVLAIVVFLGWRFGRKEPVSVAASQKVIAVLPFSNQGAGADFDYLRYAIANDLVTDLAHAHSVSVRPFASTSTYGSQSVDPAAAGAELRVTHVVSGAFLLENGNLRVNMELVDAPRNQLIWREEVAIPPGELISLHDKLANLTAHQLLPAMHVAEASPDDMPRPKNEGALQLFLHSLTIPLDPSANQLAIKKLQESISLDGTYAPAWEELGWRFYIDYHYGNGGKAAVASALLAYKRASELDPDWPAVSTTIRVEQGDLDGAYDQAGQFLKRHPEMALAHYSLSYVLRYGGLLTEAGKECDRALAIDPGFNVFRSCATPFILAGDYKHARTYIQLDESSGFAAMLRLMIALRSGNRAVALAESNAALQGGFQFADPVRKYLNEAPNAELRKAADALEVDPRSSEDPEMLYFNAAALSFSGQGDAAFRQLRRAIDGNLCSYPAMDNDPLFDSIRSRPEFDDLRRAAMQCQQRFLAHRQQADQRSRSGL